MEKWKQWKILFWGSKITLDIKLNILALWNKKLWQPRQHIKMQRHHFVDNSSYNQSYGFSSSHVWVWELEYKESWALKNWSFWTVVLEKTLERSLDRKKIKPVNPKGNQSWVFIGRTDAVISVLSETTHLPETTLCQVNLLAFKSKWDWLLTSHLPTQ